ncbi:hypothetical protein [Pseudohalioglobus lutimaris]|uniref:Uncharacterized protein n=1 Tax=Pseudohalioglobus lutimaris TaxID=1737061 RepID=A0A2N5X840_9GAMM|nr:hypothetical protein [Pseudohalioglobus lutimaris]PLW70660.1 hypothetical protein C0039_00565 [Pseudohalioglobus lutimaris]
MLSVNKLEKIIELEENLRAEYQNQIDEKAALIESQEAKQAELQTAIDNYKVTVEKQLETITELSRKTEANQKVEQQNRELNNRAGNLEEKVAELKKRVKGLQKDLAEERSELQKLKQFDPARMKKNLDANKKKLAEQTKANSLLQKSLAKIKGEKAEAQRKVSDLEAQLSELKTDLETEAEAEEQAA